MTEVFLEREFDVPVQVTEVLERHRNGENCFRLHRVVWQVSLLSEDGRRMICRFRGRDVQSVQNALGQAGADHGVAWLGSVHDAPELSRADMDSANVVVTRTFEKPVTLDSIQAIEDAGAWCLETHNVKFIRTFFSLDRKRMVCTYHAPDAESVRLAQRQASMPVERVWPFKAVRPDG